ncbi:MAG TPA: glycosyltransferase family 4 protein [Cyclobacteriaceae bacterium]|nr:glycosyltransferase family 4 protein [Cyclobacteriaceae bacterium]
MARLNFILPSLPTKPVGGVKNMFQFANRLRERGHDVTIYYSIRRPFKKQKTPVWLRLLISKLRKGKVASWFALDPSISQEIIPEVSDRHIRDADASMCTWWQMAYAINELGPSKGFKVNFIQDYELWTGQEERVHESYKLPVQHVVIAKYLQDIVEKFGGVRPPLVNTPIDTSHFRMIKGASERSSQSVIMMYSEEPRKGTQYGIEALRILKKEVPSLKVTLFSVYQRSQEVPDWMDFFTRPSNLVELYNEHAIFFSPSLGEGWALPPAESMACGCAVVCTDIGGHRDYAIDGQTALLVPAKDVTAMAAAIKKLIEDDSLRMSLSRNGHRLISTEFTWDQAVLKLEQILKNAVFLRPNG